MMRRALLLLLLLTSSVPAWPARLLLCGGPEVVEAEVVKVGSTVKLEKTWSWKPEHSQGLPVGMMRKFITTDDCKPVSGGRELLITSSGDAVALVAREDGRTLFYAKVRNAHAATLIPGDLVAVASSSDDGDGQGNRLVLFDRHHSDVPVFSMPLRAAHGVEWDGRRNVLWALGGDKLLRLTLSHVAGTPRLDIQKEVALPAPEGHDLQIARDGGALYVTNTRKVFSVDPETMIFKPYGPFEGLSQIKSLSVPASGPIAYTQADPGVWWTYTLRFLGPPSSIALEGMIYKVRWLENVSGPTGE